MKKNALSDKLKLLTKPNIEIKSGENQMNQKTNLYNLSILTSELSKPTSKLIHIEAPTQPLKKI